MGEINGCGACKKHIEIRRGKKYLYTGLKGQYSEIVSLFLVLMAPVILKKVSC